LRAWRFADIPTPLPVQNIRSVPAVVTGPLIFFASLALVACAIAHALAPQRFSATSATVIASVRKAAQPILGSALASPRLPLDGQRVAA
jgi:hypothetical protein